jgi:MFS_1 like family
VAVTPNRCARFLGRGTALLFVLGIKRAESAKVESRLASSMVLVFVLLGPWLLSLLGRSGALALAAGAAVVRWGVMAQTADVSAVALVEPLHGLTFALFHLGCMRIIADTVPSSLAGMAQAYYGTVGIGGATALSTILSGWLFARWGTCRILGNGFSMLPSVSHYLELAHCAFTRFQRLEAWLI